MTIKKEQIDVLLQSIKVGMNDKDSCRIARVSQNWYYMELRNNPKFAEEVEAVRGEWKRNNLVIIQNAAVGSKKKKIPGVWQASAWLLERRFPREFANRQRIDITIDSVIVSIVDILKTCVPDNCPHCQEKLDMKQEAMKKLEALATEAETKEANDGNGSVVQPA